MAEALPPEGDEYAEFYKGEGVNKIKHVQRSMADIGKEQA